MTFTEHKITHENATNIIDYLGLVFHEDLNNKLDYYHPTELTSIRKIESDGFNFLINASFSEDRSVFAGEGSFFRARSGKLFIDLIIK